MTALQKASSLSLTKSQQPKEPTPTPQVLGGRGNSFAQAGITGSAPPDSYLSNLVGPAKKPTQKPSKPKKPFTQMGSRDQMAYMAQHYENNRTLLDANKVSPLMEELMAAQTPQEIDENSRRGSLSTEYQKHAKRLAATLKKKKLNNPSELSEKDRAQLPEEQRFLLNKAQSGQLDLSTLGSKDKKVQAANEDRYADLGQENRSAQYAEMEKLRAIPEKKRTRAQRKRFRRLQRKPSHMKGNTTGIGDIWGMSKERFSEIYDKGNTRFEEQQYKALRGSYKRNNKRQKNPNKPVISKSGIGGFNISPDGRKEIKNSGNYDILADMATSYGAGQVMGGYTASKNWRGRYPAERLMPLNMPGGSTYTPTIEDAKRAGKNRTPDKNDLQLQMSVLGMSTKKPGGHDRKAGLNQPKMSNDQFIKLYNGSSGGKIFNQYKDSLRTNRPLYRDEKKKVKKQDTSLPGFRR